MTAFVPPVAIDLPAAGLVRRSVRQAETAAVFAQHLGPVLARRAVKRPMDSKASARHLRRVFDNLGSTYVKFGQLVGSSPGAFGATVSDEFRTCLDTGPAVPFTAVVRSIETTFGQPLSELFDDIDETPLAAASIAVVHKAVLPDGRAVAVKVLRPGIAERVALDLDIMQPLFRRLALSGVPIAGPLYRFLSGFRTQVAEELDLRNEARTMTHFGELAEQAGLDRIVIPAPIEGLAGRDVLVMDLLDGVPIDDLDAIEALGHDPRPLVRDLLRLWFLTGLRDGMFHGDIHAGNLMMLRNGRLGLIDWGIVGILDEETRRIFRRFVEAILGDDSAWADIADFMKRMAPFRFEDGDGPFREEGRREIRDLLTRPFGEADLTGAFKGPERRFDREPGDGDRRSRRERIKEFRRHAIGSGFADGRFAQANFLLFKQLLYFERYGKLYLADEALMGDRDWLEHVLRQTEPSATPNDEHITEEEGVVTT